MDLVIEGTVVDRHHLVVRQAQLDDVLLADQDQLAVDLLVEAGGIVAIVVAGAIVGLGLGAGALLRLDRGVAIIVRFGQLGRLAALYGRVVITIGVGL